MNYLNKITFVAVLFGLAGCSIFGSDSPTNDSPREIWESLEFDDYSFDLSISCFCGITQFTPARVTVLADTVASAVRISDDSDIASDVLDQLLTIDELFDIVESATSGGADDIVTEYSETQGYPISVAIDYIENAIDDEINYTASNLSEILTKTRSN